MAKIDTLYEDWSDLTGWTNTLDYDHTVAVGNVQFDSNQAALGESLLTNDVGWDLDESSIETVLVEAGFSASEHHFILTHSGGHYIDIWYSGYEGRFRVSTKTPGNTTYYNTLTLDFPIYVLVEEASGTTKVYTSPDRAAWTERASFSTLTGHTDVDVEFYGYTDDDTQIYKWGTINPDSIPPGSETITAAFLAAQTELFNATVEDPSVLDESQFLPQSQIFHIALYHPYTNQRLDVIQIDPEVIDLSFSTTLRGFENLTVAVPDADDDEEGFPGVFIGDAYIIRPFAHVEVFCGVSKVFEGRIVERQRSGPIVRSFSAVGYGFSGLNDNVYITSGTSNISTGQLLADIVNNTAVEFKYSENSFDPGIIVNQADYTNRNVDDIFSQIEKMGSITGDDVYFSIWEDKRIQAGFLTVPDDPHYAVEFGKNINFTESYDDVYGSVAVVFDTTVAGSVEIPASTAAVATATVTHNMRRFPNIREMRGIIEGGPGSIVAWYFQNLGTSTFQIVRTTSSTATKFGWAVDARDIVTTLYTDQTFFDTYGVYRTRYIEGGNLTSSEAESYAEKFLEELSKPVVSASITIDSTGLIRDIKGAVIPKWNVRSTESIVVGSEEPLIIHRTSYNAFTDTLTIEAGSPSKNMEALLASFEQNKQDVERRISSKTGAATHLTYSNP